MTPWTYRSRLVTDDPEACTTRTIWEVCEGDRIVATCRRREDAKVIATARATSADALDEEVKRLRRVEEVADERKVALADADTTLLTVRIALGYDPAGNGWRPPRGVDPVVDLALDARADRDALAAIRVYFTATSDLAREEFTAEWEAIPEEDRARFQAWGDRACQAGIDAGEEATAEAERDRLAKTARAVVAAWDLPVDAPGADVMKAISLLREALEGL